MDSTGRFRDHHLTLAALNPSAEDLTTSKPFLNYSCIPEPTFLLDLKIRRNELKNIINYYVANHHSFFRHEIIKKKDSGLAFSFALNSATGTPILLLKNHRVKELSRDLFSVSLAFDIQSQTLKVFKSGPKIYFTKNEFKINTIIYNSDHRDK